MVICPEEVQYHSLSFGDPSGRVFWWRDQLHRGITSERSEFYRRLMADGTIRRLIEKGLLVETELTDLEVNGYPLVLRHRTIPFVSYAPEWCGAMLKAAALQVLALQMELRRIGLTLQDAHPWNVLFDGAKPCIVDLGSIVPADPSSPWAAKDEFLRFFRNPLCLMAHGHSRVARMLLQDFDLGVQHSEVESLGSHWRLRGVKASAKTTAKRLAKRILPKKARSAIRQASSWIHHDNNGSPRTINPLMEVRELRFQIEAIEPTLPQTIWSDYYGERFPAFSPNQDWNPKHHTMLAVLEELRPKTVLDVGSNRGWFAQLAARHGADVVGTDVDESAVTKLYFDAKSSSLSIVPLIMDLRNPLPATGLCNEWFPAGTERLRADLVVALALVHHLVPKQKLRFDQIVRGLSAFAKQALLVEFIAPEDQCVREWWNGTYAWYKLDAFVAELAIKFKKIRKFPSNLEHRIILLCER